MKYLLLLMLLGCQTVKNDTEPKSILVPGDDIIVFGDWGTGTTEQQEVANGMTMFCSVNECSFVITLGDNFYPSGVESVRDQNWDSKFQEVYNGYGRLNLVFYPSLGNHDHYGKWKPQIEYEGEFWNMPSRYYHIQTDYTDLYAIDTQKFDDEQIEWLDEQLAESKMPWRIVYGHHPVYSNGSHGDTGKLKSKLLPILKRHNVHFYLAGHDHDQEIIEKHGIVFVIAGAAGKLRDLDSTDNVFGVSELGFSHLSIRSQETRLLMLNKLGQVLFERRYSKD